MVLFTDAATYMEQSILLLQARPTTTRISTRYTLSSPRRPKASGVGSASESETVAPRSRGELVLKTYDPVSGACLKYRTSKQAEVGRLVGAMGRCARVMANVPLQAEEEEGRTEGADAGQESAKMTTAAAAAAEQGKSTSQPQQQQQSTGGTGGGGGGGKKKKKGKK